MLSALALLFGEIGQRDVGMGKDQLARFISIGKQRDQLGVALVRWRRRHF